jgi:uracil-DNA glycosylase
MTQYKELSILKWYNAQGVDEVISNNTRTYLKKKDSSEISHLKAPIIKQPTKYISPNNATKLAKQIADTCTSISELKTAVEKFDGCVLKKTATNTVFSDGNPDSKVMLIGEAPGANEDLQGVPFCGESGKLLDKVLKSIGLDRKENLYITNSIFWRPPGNRKPTDEEIRCCLPFVEKHIGLMKPNLIILAGSVAASTLFGNLGPISKQRQKIFKYKNEYLDQEISTVIIYHPSYLLRQPSQKKLAWYDMLFIKDILGSTIPSMK